MSKHEIEKILSEIHKRYREEPNDFNQQMFIDVWERTETIYETHKDKIKSYEDKLDSLSEQTSDEEYEDLEKHLSFHKNKLKKLDEMIAQEADFFKDKLRLATDPFFIYCYIFSLRLQLYQDGAGVKLEKSHKLCQKELRNKLNTSGEEKEVLRRLFESVCEEKYLFRYPQHEKDLVPLFVYNTDLKIFLLRKIEKRMHSDIQDSMDRNHFSVNCKFTEKVFEKDTDDLFHEKKVSENLRRQLKHKNITLGDNPKIIEIAPNYVWLIDDIINKEKYWIRAQGRKLEVHRFIRQQSNKIRPQRIDLIIELIRIIGLPRRLEEAFTFLKFFFDNHFGDDYFFGKTSHKKEESPEVILLQEIILRIALKFQISHKKEYLRICSTMLRHKPKKYIKNSIHVWKDQLFPSRLGIGYIYFFVNVTLIFVLFFLITR